MLQVIKSDLMTFAFLFNLLFNETHKGHCNIGSRSRDRQVDVFYVNASEDVKG
jgi:hypothetical protein